jgi:enamine deaminase RidA (YjgF/YER057c/UK114 family)
MIVQRQWSSLAGIRTFNVIVGGPSGGSRAAADLFSAALAEIGEAGFSPANLVRSRIWARDAAIRKVASDARLSALSGDLRAASASFIAPERLAPGVDVLVDLTALAGEGGKVVHEYEPKIAPPMFVRIGGLVFLSGNTDESATFEAQMTRIRAKIAASLAAAETTWDRIVAVAAYFHRDLDRADAVEAVAADFSCPVVLTTVEGYSAPEKRIEIEVTARLP